MTDITDKIQTEIGGILENKFRQLTGTEKEIGKLSGLGKLGNSSGGYYGSLDYPAGIGDSSNLNGHYIQFQILSQEGTQVNGATTRTVSPRTPGSVNQITTDLLGLNDLKYQIINTIRLYMPEQIKSTYNADWDLGEVGAGTAGLLALRDIGDSDVKAKAQSAISAFGDILGSKLAGDAITQSTTDAIQALTQSDAIRNTTAAKDKRIRNPHVEFLFKGVGTRQFNFEFRFNPWNEQEAKITKDIIKQFKMAMHPKVDHASSNTAIGIFLKYPNIFLIKYYSHDHENVWLNKIGRAALVNLDVDYAASGTSSFHREMPGSGSPPSDVNITMSFIELDILTRESMEAGY